MLVEDHHVLRGGLRMLINAQPDMTVIAEAGDGLSALELVQQGTQADIMISDLNMPKMDGFALFAELEKENIGLKPIAFSMLNSEKQIERAFNLGCYGYLTKSIESEELLFGIRQVAVGKKYLCSDVIDAVIDNFNIDKDGFTEDLPEFSERELLILEKIAQGLTTTQIADEIYLGKRTVEGHRQSLLDKTGSRNTAVLIKYAVQHNLVR